MSRLVPAFPPDVAQALQRPDGRVSVRYTLPQRLDVPRTMDIVVMQTPYEAVLAGLILDTKDNLRFVRTGNRAEGARVALVKITQLIAPGRHWDIELDWNADEMTLAVRDQQDADGRTFEGRWPT